jgi:hypothetical protein
MAHKDQQPKQEGPLPGDVRKEDPILEAIEELKWLCDEGLEQLGHVVHYFFLPDEILTKPHSWVWVPKAVGNSWGKPILSDLKQIERLLCPPTPQPQVKSDKKKKTTSLFPTRPFTDLLVKPDPFGYRSAEYRRLLYTLHEESDEHNLIRIEAFCSAVENKMRKAIKHLVVMVKVHAETWKDILSLGKRPFELRRPKEICLEYQPARFQRFFGGSSEAAKTIPEEGCGTVRQLAQIAEKCEAWLYQREIEIEAQLQSQKRSKSTGTSQKTDQTGGGPPPPPPKNGVDGKPVAPRSTSDKKKTTYRTSKKLRDAVLKEFRKKENRKEGISNSDLCTRLAPLLPKNTADASKQQETCRQTVSHAINELRRFDGHKITRSPYRLTR